MNVAIDAVFRALADPTRREIIDLLSQSQQSVKQITANFAISQPAVSQHLRELRASGLVRAQKVGVEHHYSLTPAPLADVSRWVERYRVLFDPSGHAWGFAPAHGGKRHGD